MKLLVIAIAVPSLSYLLAVLLRFDMAPLRWVPQETLVLGLFLLILSRTLLHLFFEIHRYRWRYFGFRDLQGLVSSLIASSTLFAALVLLFRLPSFPRSILFIEFLLALVLSLTVMGARRYLHERRQSLTTAKAATNSIILGAGNTGNLVARSLLSSSSPDSPRPLFFLDDNLHLQRQKIHGIEVKGPLRSLRQHLEQAPKPLVVILAIPSYGASGISDLRSICSEYEDVSLRVVRGAEQLLSLADSDGSLGVKIEQVLEKDTASVPSPETQAIYSGKSILVTGGAGSIGSEIVRQLLLMKPKKVTSVDNSEYHTFQLERELQSNQNFQACIGDIREPQSLAIVFNASQPQILLHAAALKHVHLCEKNPQEAIRTNILGTIRVLEAAERFNIQRLTLLSTDKAVDPTNVMGLTKRASELLFQQYALEHPSCRVSIVRFGNVLNSRGSVIPLFLEQIREGGPITITDSQVERYFMSIHEAVQLVLSSQNVGESGDVCVLKMGCRVKIKDIAEQLLNLYQREDIPIVYTGLRPGERLIEELVSESENLQATAHPRIDKIAGSFQLSSQLMDAFLSIDFEDQEASLKSVAELIEKAATKP